MLITPYLPDNLDSLHNQEEQIRTSSNLTINGDGALKDHINLIHGCLDTIVCVAKEHEPTKAESEQVIYGLGIRLFNSTACALKLSLSGYHQGAAAFLRDVVEIAFLLDYFRHKPQSVGVWKNSKDWKEREQFKPYKIREVLDKRDGFQEKKRAEMYSLLSKYGTHATFEGFQLTTQNQQFFIGPFESEKLLKALIEETCKVTSYAVVIYLTHWTTRSSTMIRQKVHFFESMQAWWKRYMNSSFDEIDLSEIKQLMSQLPN